MNKPIRILSLNMDILAEIDNYESMFFNRSWYDVGTIELRINRHIKYANTLLKDNLILIGTDLNKVFIIKHREIELDESGKVTENWLIKGYSLKSIIAQRITIPPANNAYDIKTGTAETVMKYYVYQNLVNPINSKRKIPHLLIETDQQRGIQLSYSTRFKNLAEDMNILSLSSKLGWDVTLDLKNKKWIFDVMEGRNLTVGQSVNPPVIFSPQFESLKSLHYTESELNYKNLAIVAGQGEGVDRRIIEVGDYTSTKRHEVFIDARDIAEVDENQQLISQEKITEALVDRGKQQLKEFMQEEYLEGQVLTNSPFEYQKDYDLGDFITIQNSDWNISMDAQITDIKEIYETTGFSIEATFGNNRPTLIQKIKQEFNQISGEVRK
ncbi:siphovirus ReqiPepy6 Gp37-like family protein [Lysinibacillus irui]|uniref:Siphovirus ReqiPepy6 Gp37-like family protein n=1 Tax=Lysinibacillus irui TaxID=2998077 RepID=A0ABU5NIR3_9BACI|nr:siphovirus ReqiPepy6 Gp37-like family protein [Lysinibacillus irui]MEA0553530.1 siphovirus ReqiPepy6 Gp37-like family protein [Lysinibacillus irui]MEA0975914.1 siphovirus ReqiPepy6 Gp37-like family protein [Lysinibacillus irui]MEA1042068.1 siphovirus ReqiPepy6 Gp37-like family protein [Lysinibacillus irui]